MVTFFSWRKIHRKTGGSSNRILRVMQAIASERLPRNRQDPIYRYYYTDFSGKSFILDLQSLVFNYFRYTPKELAQYLGLASLRSYSNYKLTGDASLDLFHSPVDQDTINQNRLLRIKDDKIYFYYEEDTDRRKELW